MDPKVLVDLYGEQQPASPLDKLLAGAIVFDRLDGFDFRGRRRIASGNLGSDRMQHKWND